MRGLLKSFHNVVFKPNFLHLEPNERHLIIDKAFPFNENEPPTMMDSCLVGDSEIENIARGLSFIDDKLLFYDLITDLVSDDEERFIPAIKQVVSIADMGNENGVEALRAALRIRSGVPPENVYFFEFGGDIPISDRLDKRKNKARDEIVAIAQNQALQRNTFVVGFLTSYFCYMNPMQAHKDLLEETYKVGGISQRCAFQLIINEIRFMMKRKNMDNSPRQ